MNHHSVNGHSPRRHIVLLTYEFTYAPFSGNGILARSVVKSLLRQDCLVTVWCCRPAAAASAGLDWHHHHLTTPELTTRQAQSLTILTTTVHNGWKRLDRYSCWSEFQYDRLAPCDQDVLTRLLQRQQQQRRNVQCAFVDWTGACAWRTMPSQLTMNASSSLPLTYLNFRIFALGSGHHVDKQWYEEKERDALHEARVVITLSHVDRVELISLLQDKIKTNESDICPTLPMFVLQPPLRADIRELAVQYSTLQQHRQAWGSHLLPSLRQALDKNQPHDYTFVTCLVRLSPEKEAMRFAHFCQQAAATLGQAKLIPVLVGAEADPSYAHSVQAKLKQVLDGNAIVISQFLQPTALAALLSHTRLNFHPCSYDAFGMTIMEAAAFRVPSIVANGGQVGATTLLGEGAFLPAHMSDKVEGVSDIDPLRRMILDAEDLENMGERARMRALAWDQDAYGERLVGMLGGSDGEEANS